MYWHCMVNNYSEKIKKIVRMKREKKLKRVEKSERRKMPIPLAEKQEDILPKSICIEPKKEKETKRK